jgi:magnesium transporter
MAIVTGSPVTVPEFRHGIVAAGVYAGGRRVANTTVEQAGEWSRQPGHVVWIGLLEPDDELLRRVQQQFKLHDLAIEDAAKAHQRPKLEQYGEGLFIVARTAQMMSGRIVFGETHIFLGRGYVVTVRHGPSTSYARVRERCEASPQALAQGEDYILYAILDFIVDDYMPVLQTVRDEVEVIEDQVLASTLRQADIERLYQLRRDLLRLRNAVSPLVEVCTRLERAELPCIDLEMRPLFRDVADHVRRVQEDIGSLREVLDFAFEASLMMGQSQQTEITRKLAAWAAILAIPTAVAGFYGMNFDFIPELHWHYGYFVVLGLTIGVCGLLYWRFHQSEWL